MTVQILDLKETVTEEFKQIVSRNPDVALWLGKVGFSTRPHYLTSLCYFLKCVNIENPSTFLDLKTEENPKQRFFPAERLVETWQAEAHVNGISSAKIKKIIDAIRSFFKHNRIPLLQIKCTYKPKSKQSICDDDLCKFREGFNWYGKFLFDFMLSAPIRDGQFQRCPNCGEEFFPRWRNITTFPVIEAYSPFIIRPQKGHESSQYDQGLLQVCFLTETAAKSLNIYRDLKQRVLGRELKSNEYIFTHQKSHRGEKHIAPVAKMDVVFFFQQAKERTGIKVYPHLLRSWVNSILASRGIEKQLRDLYLGHSSAYEEGYIMQLLPQWQNTFRQAKAMEHLDIIGGFISTFDIEEKLLQIEEQQKEIQKLKEQLDKRRLTEEEEENLKWLLEQYKQGKLKVTP